MSKYRKLLSEVRALDLVRMNSVDALRDETVLGNALLALFSALQSAIEFLHAVLSKVEESPPRTHEDVVREAKKLDLISERTEKRLMKLVRYRLDVGFGRKDVDPDELFEMLQLAYYALSDMISEVEERARRIGVDVESL